jgi:hypothetical protein
MFGWFKEAITNASCAKRSLNWLSQTLIATS